MSVSIATRTPSACARRACRSFRSRRDGLCVDLHRLAVPLRGAEHALDVDVHRRAGPEEAARRVREDVDVRVRERAAHPARHLGPRLLEHAVDRRDDQVELGEQLVGVVERAVRADVALGAGEHADPEWRRSAARMRRTCARISPGERPRATRADAL